MNAKDELLITTSAYLIGPGVGISFADMKKNLIELYEKGMVICDAGLGRCRITPEGRAALARVKP